MTVPTISNLPTVPATSDPNFETEAPALFNHIKNTFVSEMNSAISFINSSTFDATVEFKNASFTAAKNFLYMIDTTGGAVTVTLPASPATGDQLLLMDQKRYFATNNLTIGRNGKNINGAASDVVSKSTGALIRCVYNSTYGWTVDLYEGQWESGTSAGDLVYNGGKVGIGTSSPEAELQVHNPANAAAYSKYTNVNTGATATDGTTVGISTTGDFQIWNYESSEVQIATNNVQRVTITADGNFRLNFPWENTNNLRDSQTTSNRTPKLQINSTSGPDSGIGLISYNTSTAGYYSPQFWLAKSNGNTVGQNTIVSDGTDLGSINFAGNDGSNFLNAASIRAEVEGTPSSNAMPGRLVFYTNSGGINPSQRLTIDSSGKVGIGTSSPDAKLEIGIGASNADGLLVTSDNNALVTGDHIAAVSGRGSTDAYNLLKLENSTGTQMIVQGDGKVGIGTSSPSGKLDINTGVMSGDVKIGNFNNVNNGTGSNTHLTQGTKLEFIADTNPRYSNHNTNTVAFVKAEYDGSDSTADVRTGNTALTFATHSGFADSGTLSEKMRISSFGNVGIGTSDPDAKLDIDIGASNADGLLVTSSNDALVTGDHIKAVSGRGSTDAYNLLNLENSTGTKMIVRGDGNVGIGTSSPDFELHIENVSPIIMVECTNSTSPEIRMQNTIRAYTNYIDSSGKYILRDTTAAANRLVIDGSGNVEVSTGNLVIGTAGKGIDFGVASAPVTSQLLTDYEEGTFTPTYEPNSGSFTSITHYRQTGNYTKIGNTVHCWIDISTNELTVGTASGGIYISGLPFTIAANSNAIVGAQSGWITNAPDHAAVQSGQTKISLRWLDQSTQNYQTITTSNIKTGTNTDANRLMGISFSYKTS